MTSPVRDNKEKSRFEMDADGHVAFADYRREGNAIEFRHTEVPKALEGRGLGSALVRGALALAKAEGLAITARCPFVKAYIERHPEAV
jgi:predicted GNAT family acetyltransferase